MRCNHAFAKFGFTFNPMHWESTSNAFYSITNSFERCPAGTSRQNTIHSWKEGNGPPYEDDDDVRKCLWHTQYHHCSNRWTDSLISCCDSFWYRWLLDDCKYSAIGIDWCLGIRFIRFRHPNLINSNLIGIESKLCCTWNLSIQYPHFSPCCSSNWWNLVLLHGMLADTQSMSHKIPARNKRTD